MMENFWRDFFSCSLLGAFLAPDKSQKLWERRGCLYQCTIFNSPAKCVREARQL